MTSIDTKVRDQGEVPGPIERRPGPGGSRLLLAAAAWLLIQPVAGHAHDSYAALVRRVSPSVVSVLVSEQREDAAERAVERATADTNGIDTALRRLTAGSGSTPAGAARQAVLGSGFIIDPDGIIVTNRHVVIGGRAVRVKLADGREMDAQIIGADAATDIALLRVHAGRLPALKFAAAGSVAVGDPVIAIGNPFGLGQSVTAGIISARGRTLENDPYIDFLQTDAAINHGNSGGPLLSAEGTVIGITSAILSPSGGSVGLGFAIPSETVASIIAELESQGRVDRGYLGISIQALTPALALALGSGDPATGALIAAVDRDGPSAGTLLIGDVLLDIDGQRIDPDNLGKIMTGLRPGSSAAAKVLRGRSIQSVQLTVGRLPDPPSDPKLTGAVDTWVPGLQLAVAATSTAIRLALKADENSGLIVTQLRPNGAGALAGLMIGDLITHAGSRRLAEVTELANVPSPSAQAPLLIRVIRDGSPRFVAVTGVEEVP